MALWNRFSSGGVTQVTSSDSSVTVTNPTGPTVDVKVAGGGTSLGSPYFQTFPLAFNTASITAGISLVTLPAKLMLEAIDVFVTGFFDGTTPHIYFGWQQADAKGNGTPFASADISSGDTALTPGFAFQTRAVGNLGGKPVYTPTNHTQALWAGITSATGTDPGNSKGSLTVILRGHYWSN